MRYFKIARLAIIGLMTTLAMQAQSDFPLQFADKDGNVIADGSTLNITEAGDDGFGGVLMPSGLYVKNTSSDEVQCGGSFNVKLMSNGAFQSCFPSNCMQASKVGRIRHSKTSIFFIYKKTDNIADCHH